MTWFNLHTDDLAAARLDDVAADDGVLGPVGAFHQDVGLQCRDHVVRRGFIEDDDRIDAAQGFEDFHAFQLRRDWPALSFVGADGSIRVHADDQHVAELARPLQVA